MWWTLTLIVYGIGSQSVAVTTIDFKSEQSCKAAATEHAKMLSNTRAGNFVMLCSYKG